MDELEDLNEQIYVIFFFYQYESWGRGLGSRKASLTPL